MSDAPAPETSPTAGTIDGLALENKRLREDLKRALEVCVRKYEDAIRAKTS